MAESNHRFCISLITAMDHLWFHHVILIAEPTSLVVLKAHSQTPDHSLSASSPVSPLVEGCNDEAKAKEVELKERPTRLNITAGRGRRSQSSSPLSLKRPRNLRRWGSTIALQKWTSCRSLWDLELEEVKGFMDLGFIFTKEHLNPQMISVIPGLQRAIGSFKNKNNSEKIDKDDEIDHEEKEYEHEKGIIRPYLSEAWLIKRPDSPLLNLRFPRVIAAAEMKKHLKFWAKTVASEVQQEC
ncbi:uncharacterized protein LOC123210968 [Mangifera indica]|uniref:uncharacterized protein LOC123210968 n=1 Tax=Mangifera indica TaxID=29780 RepID=UPI001CFA442D|nr:uncharacterized protein LOC123210968 [Mangifera indica]